MAACALLLCLAAPVEAAAPAPPWGRLHKTHPRLYLNELMLPAIRARALGAEKAHFERVKRWVNQAPAEPPVADHGARASAAALLYLATRDKVYLARAKALLNKSIDFYEQCVQQKKAVNWYSHSRINAIAAWD